MYSWYQSTLWYSFYLSAVAESTSKCTGLASDEAGSAAHSGDPQIVPDEEAEAMSADTTIESGEYKQQQQQQQQQQTQRDTDGADNGASPCMKLY